MTERTFITRGLEEKVELGQGIRNQTYNEYSSSCSDSAIITGIGPLSEICLQLLLPMTIIRIRTTKRLAIFKDSNSCAADGGLGLLVSCPR